MLVRQTRRVEYKYLLHTAQAAAVRNEVCRFMQRDSHGNTYDSHAYPIYSLYFDTRGADAYLDKVEGLPQRQKIRIRTYTPRYSNKTALFLEYKQKQNDISYKLRQPITVDDYEALRVNPKILLKKNLSPFVSNITSHIITHQLIPKSFISFRREAFMDCQKSDIRINFDYQLQSTRENSLFSSTTLSTSLTRQIILEIKYWRTIPSWLRDIIQWYQLERVPFSKYCQSIVAHDTVSHILPN